MITQAMWTHGHTMRVENAAGLASVWRAGFFIRVVGKPNTTNWFHFAVPTSVIVKDKRQMTDSVMLRFRANSTAAAVTAVHVYDGERRIVNHDGLNLSPTTFGLNRFDVPGKPDVLWGIGISVGVRFSGGTDAQNTLEFAAAGCDFKLLETVRLHVKVLTAPTRFTIDQMIAGMRESYEPAGFRVVRASDENLNLPALNVVDVGGCTRGETTEEQRTLFGNRNNVGTNEVVAYFVQATNPPLNGCAAHPDGRPGAVVASGASRWTLGHEIGHVLGLNHVNDNNRLMTGNGTDNITNPPPDLINSEITTMRNSAPTINP
ncbi:DUF6623 family protein [Micromonospora sp. NPDC050686]|uniref:DUF6623 family protein n=1 Tax=Micromonospora sp. NPDC050686 TaxID=3154631 RepID=UPI0033D77428